MGTSDEWIEDGASAGGVGTIARPAAAPPRVPPRRTGRPRPARRPVGHLAPAPALAPDTAPRPAARAVPRTQQMPFFLLLCGLLGGALICALVISTTLAAGSFRITRLQQANSALARQRQVLQDQVAQARSAQVIEQRALQLGMRPVGRLQFLNLKTGELRTDAGTGAVTYIHVPGYTP